MFCLIRQGVIIEGGIADLGFFVTFQIVDIK